MDAWVLFSDTKWKILTRSNDVMEMVWPTLMFSLYNKGVDVMLDMWRDLYSAASDTEHVCSYPVTPEAGQSFHLALVGQRMQNAVPI